MLNYSNKKQLIFGILFVVVATSVIGSAYYFLRSEPSCIDGILNQGEEKVDCGGPCFACKQDVKMQDLEVLSYNSFFLGNGKHDALAKIRNPNPSHGARLFSYKFKFYNQAKELIAEKSGTSYILAHQTRYVIESNITVSVDAAFADFSIDPLSEEWVKQDEVLVTLPIFSKKYEKVSEKGIEFAQVTGTVNNPGISNDFSSIDIQVVLVDADKKPIAAGKTIVNNLRMGENRQFNVIFSKDTLLPADIYAEATTNIFDEANIK